MEGGVRRSPTKISKQVALETGPDRVGQRGKQKKGSATACGERRGTIRAANENGELIRGVLTGGGKKGKGGKHRSRWP